MDCPPIAASLALKSPTLEKDLVTKLFTWLIPTIFPPTIVEKFCVILFKLPSEDFIFFIEERFFVSPDTAESKLKSLPLLFTKTLSLKSFIFLLDKLSITCDETVLVKLFLIVEIFLTAFNFSDMLSLISNGRFIFLEIP